MYVLSKNLPVNVIIRCWLEFSFGFWVWTTVTCAPTCWGIDDDDVLSVGDNSDSIPVTSVTCCGDALFDSDDSNGKTSITATPVVSAWSNNFFYKDLKKKQKLI